jgi:hypothetical protein
MLPGLEGVIMAVSRKPHPEGKFAYQWIRRHFQPFAAEKLVTTSRYFPDRLKAELAEPLAELTDEVGPDGYTGLYFRGELGNGFSSLLVADEDPVLIASSHFEEVDLGNGERIRCLKNGLWLGGEGNARFAAVYLYDVDFQGDGMVRLEIAVLPGAAGERATQRILARFDDAIRKAKVLRGRVLSFERDERHGYAGVKVHTLPAVSRGEIILPESTLALIDSNIIRFTAHRPALAALGLPVKKGVLFHGAPGTGKTRTIQYIASALRDATMFLITAEEIEHLRECIALARMLQPAIVVIEDVDLIAEDRNSIYDSRVLSLLNRLLNEMDGLREDSEIMFILTTNRPEVLEHALAARPGRVDQAIEFPLPDETCRRELVRLYAGKLEIGEDALAEIVRRTRGVTASFIKELMRRAAQAYLEANGAGPVPCELFVSAIEEMTLVGGKLNAKLLGADSHAPGFVRAA